MLSVSAKHVMVRADLASNPAMAEFSEVGQAWKTRFEPHETAAHRAGRLLPAAGIARGPRR